MKPAHLSHRWILKKRTDFGIFPLDTKAFRVPRVSLWLWTGCDFLLPPTNMKVSKCCSGYRFQQEFISNRIQVSSVIINIPGSARWSHCKAIYHWQLHIVSVTGEECRSRLDEGFRCVCHGNPSPGFPLWPIQGLYFILTCRHDSRVTCMFPPHTFVSCLFWDEFWGSTRIQNQERLFRKNSHSTSKLFLCFCRVYIRG